jgi:hypothetical protein
MVQVLAFGADALLAPRGSAMAATGTSDPLDRGTDRRDRTWLGENAARRRSLDAVRSVVRARVSGFDSGGERRTAVSGSPLEFVPELVK